MAHSPVNRARLQASLACAGGLLFGWKIGGFLGASVAGIAVVLVLLAWFAPLHFLPVQRVFDCVTQALVTGISWLLLGLLYFGLFTPMRCWRVLFRRDPLAMNANPTATTYLQPLPPAVPDGFKRQF